MHPLLLLSSLLHITTGSVYNVTPDDHYYPNTTCHHCHNLQHYLLNTTEYFTSNTQLLFLPGLHHLHTDLIIQNVHNISLIGSTTDGTTPDTVIQCNSSVGIVMTNITNLIVTNITVRSCLGNEYNNTTVLIKQCTNVQLRHVMIEESHNSYGIVGINILGDSRFSYITNNAMRITYDVTTVKVKNANLSIDHYTVNDIDRYFEYKMKFNNFQDSYRVKIQILHSIFQWLENDVAIIFQSRSKNMTIYFKYCQFVDNSMKSIIGIGTDSAWFQNCDFLGAQINISNLDIIHIKSSNIFITDCRFYHNNYTVVLLEILDSSVIKVVISNTVFSSSTPVPLKRILYLKKAKLHLIGPVVFHNISYTDSIIGLFDSNLTCSNYIEFSNNAGRAILEIHFCNKYKYYSKFSILLHEGSIVNITLNVFQTFLEETYTLARIRAYKYPPCSFQYSGNLRNNMTYLIIFDNNYESLPKFAYNNLSLIHCSWLPQSPFNTIMPLEVNKKYIKYINKSGTYDMLPQHIRPKTLCLCGSKKKYDCNKELLDPVYPGQSNTLMIHTETVGFYYYDTVITVINNISWLPPTACVITNSTEMVQITRSPNCTPIEYTIAFPEENWCELFLKGSRDGIDKVDVYYIKSKPCPVGFIKLNGVCQCYQFLKQFGIMCNINDQTILRPANSWILPVLQGNIYSFDFSPHCPFQYCLPHSSNLNFSTPNSQCQFNRSGILCGHCQQGLSTVFSSSHCQQCSNVYLFLIVPIAISGLVLVLLLFILNLTVTDGTINAFILYVNIISINAPIIFPDLNKFTPAYTFISLANLDLGIQACFYNGMDDYAKMWLQLAFPFYLIFIATSLIITSRYSTTIQRLTARRALPVLATLFLLSYTKILHIVSTILFHYTSIIHLPGEHATIVWSIDANISLFGVKFCIIFIVCSLLFLVLLLFNFIMLFTKTLSRLKFVTKFRPLLDAYQGPYKIKLYYWTGVQLMIRVLFYGISSLDRNINLTIGIVLLTVIAAIHGFVQPFKIKCKNYQEMIFLLNLQWILLFVVSDNSQAIFVRILIYLAGLHFIVIVIYRGVLRNIIELKVSKLFRSCAELSHRKRKAQEIELAEYKTLDIPEVSYDYSEYQEPLVGMD